MFEKIKSNWIIVVGSIVGLFVFLIIVGLVLVSGANSSYNTSKDSYYGYEGTVSSMNSVGGFSGGYKESFEIGRNDMGVAIPEEAVVSEEAGETKTETSNGEKLVYSAGLRLETKQLENALEVIYQNIKEHNGVVQQEDQRNYDDNYYIREGYVQQRSSYIFVRIPTEKYESFIEDIRGSNEILSVTGLSKRVENFTDTYNDLELQLKSYRTQQDRLFYFLENAETIEDMLNIESKLGDLQYKIESIETNIKSIDKDVEYSKIEINLTEVMKYTDVKENPNSFLERLSLYISSSMAAFIHSMEGILEFSIYAVPYIIVIGLVSFIIIKLIKRKRNKTSIKNNEK